MKTGKKQSKKSGRVRMTRLMLERMKGIHVEIYTNKYPTSPSLAALFDVDEKTIDRDIEMMRDRMNLPIETDRGKGGYYYDGAVVAFPDVLLTEHELASMIIAANALRSSTFAGLSDASIKLFEKLTGCLPQSICTNLAEWDEAISFHYYGEPKFDREVFEAIVNAVVKREQLIMVYATPNDEPGERVVEPYGLAYIRRDWVMFAHDYKRATVRRFIPPRMSKVRKTGKTFVRPEDFKVADYLKNTFGVYDGDTLYDVVLQFEKEVAHETRERHWPEGHRLEALPDGRVNLHMQLSHLHDINREVLSWGGDVVPLSPPELRRMFENASKKMREKLAATAN